MQIKVVENIEKIQYDNSTNFPEDYIISFTGYLDEFKFFEFFPDSQINKQNWEVLYNACLNRNYGEIDWTPNNGACYILTKEKYVEFCVAKYGYEEEGGNGGAMMIRVPIENCLKAFKNVLNFLNK